MREKQTVLAVTFYTTASAMATEKVCAAAGIPGRLAPVPRRLSAECGVAFLTDVSQEAALRAALIVAGIEFEGIFVTEF